MQRRWLSILLLVLMAYQSVGYIAAFVLKQQFHRAHVREEMEEKEEEGNLETLRFCQDDRAWRDIRWVDEKEFWYDHGLYDLHHITQSPDGEIQMVCFRDHEESEMLLAFGLMLENQKEEGQTGVELELDFEPFTAPEAFFAIHLPVIEQKFEQNPITWVGHIAEIVVPPPQAS